MLAGGSGASGVEAGATGGGRGITGNVCGLTGADEVSTVLDGG